MQETGEADAYGHRKKVDIGHALAHEIEKRTGEETMASDLTYDLRSGAPDAIDQSSPPPSPTLPSDLIRDNVTGRMIGIQEGRYAHTAAARYVSWPAQGEYRKALQHRALSAQLHFKAR